MNKELEVLNQCTAVSHDMMQWILTADHVTPSRIITVNDTVDYKRMSDEYDMVERAIVILQETKRDLNAVGIKPETYEEQIASKFPLLVDPNFSRMATHALAMYSQMKQQIEIDGMTHIPDYKIAVNNISWLTTMDNMFKRLSAMMLAYQHLTQRSSN